ncbi:MULTISPECIES: hypothetical protein [Bradyrhizobium]|nr:MULTISPECIES: hypothetical protein [Bradyrhizobium]
MTEPDAARSPARARQDAEHPLQTIPDLVEPSDEVWRLIAARLLAQDCAILRQLTGPLKALTQPDGPGS